MRSDPDFPRTDLVLALAFLAVVIGGITDLILDAPRDWRSPHVLFELALVALSLGLAVYLWHGWRQTTRALHDARSALSARSSERDRWQDRAHRLLDDLAVAVDRQFGDWGFTAAEREIAILLLKGLSHKEIAARTGRSERTVRQHAVALYRKSGLAGRAELAAFFLGALELPATSTSADAGGGAGAGTV